MRALRRHVFIPLFDRIAGDKRLSYLPQIEEEYTSKNLQELESIQVARFWQIAKTAYKHCPFYRELYDQAGVNPLELKTREDISKIPIIDKHHVYEHMSRMVNERLEVPTLIKSATGGTTASPMTFYLTRDAWSRRRAATIYFKRWFGVIPGNRQAYLWGAPQDFPHGMDWRWKLRNFFTDNSLMLFSSYLNKDTMYDFYEQLQLFKPASIQAYSTPLAILAEYMLENNLSLSIPAINVTAEPLYEYQRHVIEKAFNNKVYNWYGARELGHIGTECCLHNGLHINTWGLFLETISNNESVWETPGEIVATELYNEAMPLIRYKIGDIGIITRKDCPCAFPSPRLCEIVGRIGDVIRKKDGTYIPGISFADRILTDCDQISELQLVQKEFELFDLFIVKGKNFSCESIEKLKTTISNYLKFMPRFRVLFVESIPREASGKIRFVKNEMFSLDITTTKRDQK